jgi:hypothetical protein
MRLAKLKERVQKVRRESGPAIIVGTGPSMRLFDMTVIDEAFQIGLNQAWKVPGADLNLSITVHPELAQEYLAANKDHRLSSMDWVIKKKPPMQDLSFDDPDHYVFDTKEDFGLFEDLTITDTLFIGRGVHQTAMHLAALLGFNPIILVGCDMCSLGGEHHGHAQHVQFHGLAPKDVYAEYFAWTQKARDILWAKHRISVFTMSPFVGLGNVNADYRHQCQQRKLVPLPAPKDVSRYKRKRADLAP